MISLGSMQKILEVHTNARIVCNRILFAILLQLCNGDSAIAAQRYEEAKEAIS
jgi:flavorubredoxin